MKREQTNPQAVTPELVRRYIKHASSRSVSNDYPSGRLLETWKLNGKVLFRYTFFIDEQNVVSTERLIAVLDKEMKR